MAQVKFYTSPSDRIDGIPIVTGQFISLSDACGLYYDVDNRRYPLEPGYEILYELADPSTVAAEGPASELDYNVDTGKLAYIDDITDTEFREIEFVFYDKNNASQFSARLHGLRYGNGQQYTYAWNSRIQASLDSDVTHKVDDAAGIRRSTVYAAVELMAEGYFSVTDKREIAETVVDEILTMEEIDISDDNRVALLKVIGRR